MNILIFPSYFHWVWTFFYLLHQKGMPPWDVTRFVPSSPAHIQPPWFFQTHKWTRNGTLHASKRFHYDRPLASIENIVPFVVDLVAARGLCPRAFGVGLWKPFLASLLNVSPYPAVAVCARDSTGNKIKILLVLFGVQALFGPRVGEWAVRIVCSNFIDMLFLTWGGAIWPSDCSSSGKFH